VVIVDEIALGGDQRLQAVVLTHGAVTVTEILLDHPDYGGAFHQRDIHCPGDAVPGDVIHRGTQSTRDEQEIDLLQGALYGAGHAFELVTHHGTADAFQPVGQKGAAEEMNMPVSSLANQNFAAADDDGKGKIRHLGLHEISALSFYK